MSDERKPWSLRLRQNLINVLSDIPDARKRGEQFFEEMGRLYLKKKKEGEELNATNMSELL